MKGLKITFPFIAGAADYHQFAELQTLLKNLTGKKPSYRELDDDPDNFDGPTDVDREKSKGTPVRHMEGESRVDKGSMPCSPSKQPSTAR